ncbi:MAG: hypothetical protein JO168_16005 [Solirubrobacterales bacterium]|nr:hypothetical protein [Solirubrobacterales bacterium]
MRRSTVFALIVAGAVVFLAVSTVLARVFSVDAAERSAITGLISAQAQGDAAGMARRIHDCERTASCRPRVDANAAALKHPGTVSIIQIQPSAGFSLGSTLGTARVAWQAGGSLPIVQCIRVRRAGNAVSGFNVQLLAVTPRIRSDADCPATF